MPIVIAAIDPCFSCTDRSVSVTRSESGRSDTLDWGTLRRRGIEFHRERGIDFSGLNRILAERGKGR
jgi:NADH-quinone oxidoreductase subunit D